MFKNLTLCIPVHTIHCKDLLSCLHIKRICIYIYNIMGRSTQFIKFRRRNNRILSMLNIIPMSVVKLNTIFDRKTN